MPYSWRFFRPVVLIVLLATLIVPLAGRPSYAQDDEKVPVVIQGTPELEDLVGAIRDAYVDAVEDADVQIDPRGGLRAAFEAMCKGEVDIVMSSEPISDAMIKACLDNEQDFIETVLAYDAVALVATPDAGLTCLPGETVYDAWQLGAEEELTWADLGSELLESKVSFYGPDDLSPAYLLFKNLVPAGALREDIVFADDAQAILDKVQEEGASAFGFMSLADFERLSAETELVSLAIETEDGECVSPTLASLANRTYPLARTDYLYVNAASAERPEVRDFMAFVLAGDGGVKALGPEYGVIVAGDATYEYGVNSITGGTTGRTFSRPVTPVNVSMAQEGVVKVVGSAMLYDDIARLINREFKSRFVNADIETVYEGNKAGWDAFCAGEADVLQATREPSDEQIAQCEANGINPYVLDLGYQALVLAVPAGADWVDCLDGDTAAALFRAGTEDEPAATQWQDVNPDWPARDVLLVAPPASTGETDFLTFNLINKLTFAVRQDMVVDDDPLYRVQGVANTVNGLTYLWWTDWQGSTADVKLLGVDMGSGCVAPSPETFADGSYGLSFPVRFVFSRAAFDDPLVRAYLWHFFDETSVDTLAGYPFAGFDLDAYKRDLRDEVYNLLAAYEEQTATAESDTGGEPAASENSGDTTSDD